MRIYIIRMTTDEEIEEAARAGLANSLEHSSVQEADRVLKFQDPTKILDVSERIARRDASAGKPYGGPRRLRADFSESDR